MRIGGVHFSQQSMANPKIIPSGLLNSWAMDAVSSPTAPTARGQELSFQFLRLVAQCSSSLSQCRFRSYAFDELTDFPPIAFTLFKRSASGWRIVVLKIYDAENFVARFDRKQKLRAALPRPEAEVSARQSRQ